MSLRVLEVYAGGGGAAKGLRDAGCESVAHVEWDADACATLQAAGFGRVHEGDAREWVNTQAWKFSSVYSDTFKGVLDLAWFSPPCQPHSQQGAGRGLSDPREGTRVVVDAVDIIRPRWVIVENVMGYASSDAGRMLCEELEILSYVVSVIYLLASDFGVPQDRKRTFIIAGPTAIGPIESTDPRVSMGEAIGFHLHDAETRKGNRARPNTEPCRTVGTKGNTMVWDDTKQRRRRLTVAESATIQGFPPDWPWQGLRGSQYRQIGNAVPPKLAEVIAQAVIEADRNKGRTL